MANGNGLEYAAIEAPITLESWTTCVNGITEEGEGWAMLVDSTETNMT